MTVETAAISAALGGSATLGGPGAVGAGADAAAVSGGAPAQVGYGVSLSDFSAFQGAMARLDAQPTQPISAAAQQLMRPFEHINSEAVQMSSDAQAAQAAGRQMTPAEIVSMTVRAQEFMFHCQLVSNIANRTSDGLQQLFRQQS